MIHSRSRSVLALRSYAWLTALVYVAGWWCCASAQATQPNIIVMVSDDDGYNDFGFSRALNNQSSQFETPNLDALAAQSAVFRQGYSAAPLCSTSRAGLLTGQYQQRFGFNTNIDSGPSSATSANPNGLTAANTTIAERLKGLGYATGAVGKWHQGFQEGINLPTDKGFDEFFGLYGGGRYYFRDDRWAYTMRRGNTIIEDEYRAGGNSNTSAPDGWDPTNGRYDTDAFGDEGASFIRNHASSQNPFFLYFTPTAAHDPYEAKQQDLAHFSNISNTFLRTQAAMTFAFDRSVGKLLAALDDPAGDGNGVGHTSDSVRDNTIIVFMNDNGGTSSNNNTPFTGSKGSAYEGGIRVPFFINAAGVPASVYNAPVTAYDIAPTLIAAAGGNVPQMDSDGVDLTPFLSGANTARPHDLMFWRDEGQWAVRKGDMKYVVTNGQTALINLATDPSESVNLVSQQPAVRDDLIREFTYWEATLAKPKWANTSTQPHPYDHFVLQSASTGFGQPAGSASWKEQDDGNDTSTTLNLFDGYANTTLELPVKNGGSFSINQNQYRLSGQTFMLNELRFTGVSTNTTVRTASIYNLPLLFTKNLNGDGPKLRLDATSSGTSVRFQFYAVADIQLLDDLEITGNGTQDFYIPGSIKDYYAPRNVTKTGTSKAILYGNDTFRGNLSIQGGQIYVSGGTGAINGANAILIGSAGSLVLDNGTIAVHTIDNSAGGQFDFHGGLLNTVSYVGSLTNTGGNFSPGPSPVLATISGNYSQNAISKLTMEIGGLIAGQQFDQLMISGSTLLAGTLDIDLVANYAPHQGDVFDLISSPAGLSGTFASTLLPTLNSGLMWRLAYSPTKVQLFVDPTGNGGTLTTLGDYNGDGTVNAADYVVWRDTLGSTTNHAADGDGNGTVDANDWLVWRANFGNVAQPPGSGSFAAVPEPGTLVLSVLAGLALLPGTRSFTRRQHPVS